MPNVQETIKKAIETLGPDVLKKKQLLIVVIEDLSPDSYDDLDFIKKTYTDDIGSMLFNSYKDKSKKYLIQNDIDEYLLNKCGFNDNWRQQFIDIFSFIFGGLNTSYVNNNTKYTIPKQSRKVNHPTVNNLAKYNKVVLEEVLSKAILNKNNKLYSITANIPKPVQKLLKMQTAVAKIEESDILFVLTMENVLGVQEGIVVSKEHLLFLSKKAGQILDMRQVIDVKTYINEGGLSIKVMMKDKSIIATGINSTKYNIIPIIEFLKKGAV